MSQIARTDNPASACVYTPTYAAAGQSHTAPKVHGNLFIHGRIL